MCCKDCVSQFTGMFCESCPYFDRTPENIKEVRAKQDYQVKRDLESINAQRKIEAYYQEETDKVWDEYYEKQRKKKRNGNLLRKIAEYILD